MASAAPSLRLYRAALESCDYNAAPLRNGLQLPRVPQQQRQAAKPLAHPVHRRAFRSGSRVSHAASKPPATDRARVLARPERYAPPSHPPRGSKPRGKYTYYGGELSATAAEAQKRRRYPHMMPPEDSWQHWFLTSRRLHAGLALVGPAPTPRPLPWAR